ncbi:hypothetical protein ACTHOQ_04365 [Solibacillus silvestris]
MLVKFYEEVLKHGIKGVSIYRILPYVPSIVSERVIAQETNNGPAQEHNFEDQSSSSFNLSKTSSLQEIYNNAHAEKEACKEYMNEWQVRLYDFLHSMPFLDQLKDESYKLVLASQVNSVQTFHRAKEVVFNLARRYSKRNVNCNTHITRNICGGI